jgi:hypothetical protein
MSFVTRRTIVPRGDERCYCVRFSKPVSLVWWCVFKKCRFDQVCYSLTSTYTTNTYTTGTSIQRVFKRCHKQYRIDIKENNRQKKKYWPTLLGNIPFRIITPFNRARKLQESLNIHIFFYKPVISNTVHTAGTHIAAFIRETWHPRSLM